MRLGDGLIGPGSHNPDGLFEDRDIVAFHDTVLARTGRAWNRVGPRDALTVPEDLRAAAASPRTEVRRRAALGVQGPARHALPRLLARGGAAGEVDPRGARARAGGLVARPERGAPAAGPLLAEPVPARAPGASAVDRVQPAAGGLRSPASAGDVAVVAVPLDMDERGWERLDAALRRWDTGIDRLDYERLWVPSMLRTRVPPWLAAMAACHRPSRVLWRRAIRGRSRGSAPAPRRADSGVTAPARVARSPRPVVCVVSPDRAAYSQTFVDAHIRRLPATSRCSTAGYFPQFTADDRPLLSSRARAIALLREKAFAASRRPPSGAPWPVAPARARRRRARRVRPDRR